MHTDNTIQYDNKTNIYTAWVDGSVMTSSKRRKQNNNILFILYILLRYFKNVIFCNIDFYEK